MNGKQDQTEVLDSTWRAILPAHWLPIVFYLEWLIALRCLVAIIEDRNVGMELELAIDLLHLGACGALVSLVILLQIPISKRIALLFALWLLFSLIEAFALPFDHRSLPLSGYLHELIRGSLEKLRFVATVAAIMQGLSGLLAFFTSSRKPDESSYVRASQSSIADWLLWTSLFSLAFFPALKEWHPPDQPPRGEPWFPEIGFALSASALAGIALWGTVVIAAERQWRLRALALLIIAFVPAIDVVYLAITLRPNPDPELYLFGYIYLLTCTAPPLVSWLLLRCAGYRGYSARKLFQSRRASVSP